MTLAIFELDQPHVAMDIGRTGFRISDLPAELTQHRHILTIVWGLYCQLSS